MFKFDQKKILIISPQAWTHLNISKHHYAKELALKNEVWFLNAPENERGIKFKTETEPGYPSLHIIKYSLPVSSFFFFHFRGIYKGLNLWYVSKQLKRITSQFDVCIDFGNYLLYDDVNFVPAKVKIYFPVDDFEHLKPATRGCDFIFSVSLNILEKFKKRGLTGFFINHGLSRIFAEPARQKLNAMQEWKKADTVNVGYAGNLFIPFIDTATLKNVILKHPDVLFHFFGSYKHDKRDAGQVAWYDFLSGAQNVKLYGSLSPENLVERYTDMDAFLLCYKPDNKNYHTENSHKIFEYLSTGKVLISTPITIYKHNKLFCMSADNETFEATFNNAITALEQYNGIECMKERVLFSLDNEYKRQIERIETIIHQTQVLR